MGKLTKLLNNIKTQPEPKRDYIGASSIGTPCWRKIWLDYHVGRKEEITARKQRIFDVGKILEDYILSLLRRVTTVDHLETMTHDEHSFFRGTPDAYFPKFKAILEIKTANHASFQKVSKLGVRKWDVGYYGQVQSYMGLSGIYKCYVLVFNKNTGEFYDELVDFDQATYEDIYMKVDAIKHSKIMPPRISNNPLFYVCKMCGHHKDCHEKNTA